MFFIFSSSFRQGLSDNASILSYLFLLYYSGYIVCFSFTQSEKNKKPLLETGKGVRVHSILGLHGLNKKNMDTEQKN